MKLIDAHTHIASTRYIPPEFIEGIADNMMEQMPLSKVQLKRSSILKRMVESYQDHDCTIQLRAMDKLGIEQAVLLLPDFTYVLKGGPLSIEEMFAEHKTVLEQHPTRFKVFAGVDPRWGADGFRLFVKGVENYGFSGLKLYPPCGYRSDSELLDPYYEYCQAYKLPALIHIGPTSPALSFSEAHPMFVDAPARRYKDIAFILAHGAVNYPEDCIQLCKYRPNVYLDISGARRETDLAALQKVFASGINHKIIFGSDWPVNQANHMKGLIDVLQPLGSPSAGPVSEAETALIFAGNIERILARATLQ